MSGNTWPEQNAVYDWCKEHGIDLPHSAKYALADACTKPRIEKQTEAGSLRQQLADMTVELDSTERVSSDRAKQRDELLIANHAAESRNAELVKFTAWLFEFGEDYDLEQNWQVYRATMKGDGKPHSGDCTKEAHTCGQCLVDLIKGRAAEILLITKEGESQ